MLTKNFDSQFLQLLTPLPKALSIIRTLHMLQITIDLHVDPLYNHIQEIFLIQFPPKMVEN